MPLANSTDYYVIWDAGVVKDLAGNPIAANASTTVWNFTTASAVVTREWINAPGVQVNGATRQHASAPGIYLNVG